MINLIDSSLIDKQIVWLNFSAWLGGFTSQDDSAEVSLIFLNQNNQTVGTTTTLGPVFALDRGKITSMIFKQAYVFVPVSARSFNVLVKPTVAHGSLSKATLDNISVVRYKPVFK